MSRMKFVGNKNEVYESTLPVTNQYPELSTEEFQEVFHFLSSETEASLLHHLILARLTVHTELSNILMQYETLDHVSEYWFGETASGLALYKQAVFSLAANHIVGNKLSMDATAEAADRQEALQQKADNCLVQYRQAVDLLLNGKATYTFEMV